MNWKQMMEKARKLLADAKALMEQNQGDAFTQERENQIDALLKESDQWKERAEKARRVEDGLAYFDAPAQGPGTPVEGDVPPGMQTADGKGGDLDAVTVNAEYGTAFRKYLRGGATFLSQKELGVLRRGYIENKVLSTNTGAAGAFLAPADFMAVMIEELGNRAMMRDEVTTMPCSGPYLEMPKVEGNSTYGGIYPNGIVWTWVNSPMGEDDGEVDPTFGLLRIPMHDATVKTRLGLGLVEDSAVDIESALPRWYGEAWGIQEDYVILRGTGNGMPLGILEDTDVTGTYYVETSTSGAVKADDLIDLVYGLEEQYAANAKFVTSRTNLKTVRKLKDGSGNYIWEPGIAAGEPDTLLGHEVVQNAWAPAIAASAFPFVFGDLKRFGLGERKQMTFIVIREKYIEELKIGYMGHVRVGGQVMIPRAFRVLKIKA